LPWATPDAMETFAQAAGRHGIKPSVLRRKARAMKVLPRHPAPPGRPFLQPASAWDRVAAVCLAERKKAGRPRGRRSAR
jgi:hypothetical protein